MAVVYALVVGMLVYRRISVRGLSVTLHRSAISTAAIMFIIANAGVFGFLAQPRRGARCPGPLAGRDFYQPRQFFTRGERRLVFDWHVHRNLGGHRGAGPFALACAGFGVDPVHFGVVMVINLALGMITPPFGVNLFAAGSIAKLSLEHLIRPLLPFVAVVLACLMVITYVPDISLWLRDVVYR